MLLLLFFVVVVVVCLFLGCTFSLVFNMIFTALTLKNDN